MIQAEIAPFAVSNLMRVGTGETVVTRSVDWLVFVGFLALALPAALLIGLGVLGAALDAESAVFAGVLALAAFGALIGIRFEWWALVRASEVQLASYDEMAKNTLALFAGALVTLAITVEFGVSAIVSASIVGILAALLTPKYAVPAYCGAFVGMTSPELFTTYWHALLASGFASAVFIVAQPVFHGIGGKLGTTAFVGATLTILTTSGTFQSDPLPGALTIFLVVGYSMVGAVATFSMHAHRPPSPVFASGVVGALGGVLLPFVHGAPGELMAAGVFAASFAGMSEPKRIPRPHWILPAGAIVGLVVVYTMPYFGGSGGKLGTIAFASCLTVYGLLGAAHLVRVRRQLKTVPERDVT